jgi:ribosomal protein S18 acetylase RimI-like enzyme
VEIIKVLPSSEDYNRLREAVGWRTHPEDVIAESLPLSLYCICAVENHQVIGMGRVLGDNGLAFYIQDVIVLPEYQGRGIGGQLMDRLMNYIRLHAKKNAFIGLMAAVGKEPFYERYGFSTRPNQDQGAGMTMYWGED